MEEIWEVPGQNPPPEQVPSQQQAASKLQSIPSTGRDVMLKQITAAHCVSCLPEPP